MPKGVEHLLDSDSDVERRLVRTAVMPKGVEHEGASYEALLESK